MLAVERLIQHPGQPPKPSIGFKTDGTLGRTPGRARLELRAGRARVMVGAARPVWASRVDVSAAVPSSPSTWLLLSPICPGPSTKPAPEGAERDAVRRLLRRDRRVSYLRSRHRGVGPSAPNRKQATLLSRSDCPQTVPFLRQSQAKPDRSDHPLTPPQFRTD
jgi:hypothetical protein